MNTLPALPLTETLDTAHFNLRDMEAQARRFAREARDRARQASAEGRALTAMTEDAAAQRLEAQADAYGHGAAAIEVAAITSGTEIAWTETGF